MIQDWKAAGLLRSSVLKPVIVTVEKSMLAQTLGQLSQADRQTLRNLIQQVIQ